jgi:hypothetical protein
MATDFSELMYTSLYGSTDDFIEQIRGSLMGAGITSTAGMSRAQVASLEQTTGFTADQIDRILNNEDVNFDVQKDLDTKRNDLLISIIKVLGTGLGALIGFAAAEHGRKLGKAIASGVKTAAAGAGAGTIGGPIGTIIGGVGGFIGGFASAGGIGALLGGGVGYKGTSLLTEAMFEGDDIVSKPGYGERTLVTPQGPVALNNEDTILAYADDMASTPDSGVDFYDKGELAPTTTTMDMSSLESRVDKMNSTLQEIHQVLRGKKTLTITGLDTAIEDLERNQIRNY